MRRMGVLALFLLGAEGLFAEGNAVFLGINGFGLTADYERDVSESVSLVLEATGSLLYISLPWGRSLGADGEIALGGALVSAGFAQVRGRFYPFAARFFVDLGLGYGALGGVGTSMMGAVISPGLGWRFDPGEENGFVIGLCFCSDWVIGLPPQPREESTNGGAAVYHPAVASPLVNLKLLLGWAF